MSENSRTTPRALILLIDLVIIFSSVLISYLLRFNFSIPSTEIDLLPTALSVFLGIRFLSFLATKSFSGIIRYTETQDVTRIIIILLGGSVLLGLVDIITFYWNGIILIPRAIIIIEFISSTVGLIAFRLLVKTTYWEMKTPTTEEKKIIIFGAGEAAVFTLKALKQNTRNSFKVIAFIDDNKSKQSKKIENINIYGGDDLPKLLVENEVETLIISAQHVSAERKNELAELCLQHNTKIQYVPPVSKWINGELSANQIRNINILELLERDEIQLDRDKIAREINGKMVWVTGGAGSIGSEIVRQLSKFQPKKIIVIDNAETPLYHIDLEFSKENNPIEFIIGDVRNAARMRKAFEEFPPSILYHAAAYKHVPLMENNPSEAIFTNVNGTKLLADLASEFKVEKFIMISTDKAVNPTNIMGASKRIAEIYVQSLNQISDTKFITTRFGNVLGSNGSVIPLFNKQIQQGGPLTLTHPEITRYFMTIPEACQLVLEAGNNGNGGEIFVFDMGKSVKIIDLAKKMIKLSGLEVGKDIQIIFTGLRPGEKLYEELLTNEENTLPTSHGKIMIAKVRSYDIVYIKQRIEELISLFDSQNNVEIVKLMKEIVPEFISKNSIYEQLDMPAKD
jgi:FlaA1/EpsC-like NDP-sugar epimerase